MSIRHLDALFSPASVAVIGASMRPASVGGTVWRNLWTGRWPYWVGGLAVGLIGAFAIVRMRPLGVTAMLGSAARQWAQGQGWIPDRLDGLDGFAGCATAARPQTRIR